MKADSVKTIPVFASIRRILITTLILNWAVAAAKIALGLATHFSSITADGFHSLSDGASNIISLIGIHFACRPADKKHHYGHKKYETLYALGIAILLFFVAANLAREAINRIYHPRTPAVNFLSFAVMLATLAVNYWVMRYEYSWGKKLKSDILTADSTHTKADLLISGSVIAALAGTKLGFPAMDPAITLIIAAFIARSGYEISRESSHILCDRAAPVDVEKIERIVKSIPGVEDCHKIRTRGREDDIHIDLHVQVESRMQIDRAHEVSHAIEEAMKKSLPGITDVVVHMEPHRPEKQK